MADGDLLIEASKSRHERGGGIAVNENHVGLHLVQHRTDAIQNIGRNIEQRLPCLHNGQIIVRNDLERIQHHIQHLAVLTGYANNRFYVLS